MNRLKGQFDCMHCSKYVKFILQCKKICRSEFLTNPKTIEKSGSLLLLRREEDFSPFKNIYVLIIYSVAKQKKTKNS